jgi:hypothetical protein
VANSVPSLWQQGISRFFRKKNNSFIEGKSSVKLEASQPNGALLKPFWAYSRELTDHYNGR